MARRTVHKTCSGDITDMVRALMDSLEMNQLGMAGPSMAYRKHVARSPLLRTRYFLNEGEDAGSGVVPLLQLCHRLPSLS